MLESTQLASDLSGRNVDGPNTCPANLSRRFTMSMTSSCKPSDSVEKRSRRNRLAEGAIWCLRPYAVYRTATAAQHANTPSRRAQAYGCQITAQLLVIDDQNSPQGEPNARAPPQDALRTLACLTTMHVSGPKHSPHVRPQCGARLEISGHVSTQEREKTFPRQRDSLWCCL
ncbi:hypothetical protein V8C42DRAFT_303774 [Trichoderma barbatum]